jgi:hypothetical protein
MPYLKLDLMLIAIDNLQVQENVPEGAIACLMQARTSDGETLKIALGLEALETLCEALAKNSPRTPGTPGRN